MTVARLQFPRPDSRLRVPPRRLLGVEHRVPVFGLLVTLGNCEGAAGPIERLTACSPCMAGSVTEVRGRRASCASTPPTPRDRPLATGGMRHRRSSDQKSRSRACPGRIRCSRGREAELRTGRATRTPPRDSLLRLERSRSSAKWYKARSALALRGERVGDYATDRMTWIAGFRCVKGRLLLLHY